MAAGYDGTIRVDTSLDASGFNKGTTSITNGLKGLMSSLGGLAAAIGIAFSVSAIIAFGRASIQAAENVRMVRSKFEAVFGDLSDTVVSQLNAIQAATNFDNDDLMGFASSLQIAFGGMGFAADKAAGLSVEVIKLSTDLAVFNNLPVEQVISDIQMGMMGMTRGLRQYGITVDDAAIKQKALELGLWSGAGAMSAQARSAATLQIILGQTAYAQGAAAASTSTWTGQVRAITVAWGDFTEIMGQGFINALMGILPVVQTVLNWLVTAAQYFSVLMGALFGVAVQTGAVAANTQAAAGAAGDLADNTAAAGKAAKGALASFDQLNVLAQDTGTGATGVGAGGGGGGEIVVPPPDTSALDAIPEKVAAFVAAMKEFFAPLEEPLRRLGAAFADLGKTIQGGLQWVWDNILVPLGTWLVQTAAPVFLDLLTAAVKLLNTVLIALAPVAQWLWDNFLKPIAAWTGGVILSVLKWLTDRLNDLSTWISQNQPLIQSIAKYIAIFVGVWLALSVAFAVGMAIFNAVSGAIAFIGTVLTLLASPIGVVMIAIIALIAIIAALIMWWPQISQAATDAWNWIKGIWEIVASWFQSNVIDPLVAFFTPFWETIKKLASDAWDKIVGVWTVVSTWYNVHVIKPITDFFTFLWNTISIAAHDAWLVISLLWGIVAAWFQTNVITPISTAFSTAWEGIKGFFSGAWTVISGVWAVVSAWFQTNVIDPISTAFSTVWTSIQGGFETAFTGIKDFAKGIFNGLIDLINGLLRGAVSGINSLVGALNTVGEKVPGWIHIPDVTAPQIPLLATGAVIPPNAAFAAILGDQRSGRNIEAPEALIRQIVREETGGSGGNITIRFDGTMGELIRVLKPHIDRENRRVGGSLIRGAA